VHDAVSIVVQEYTNLLTGQLTPSGLCNLIKDIVPLLHLLPWDQVFATIRKLLLSVKLITGTGLGLSPSRTPAQPRTHACLLDVCARMFIAHGSMFPLRCSLFLSYAHTETHKRFELVCLITRVILFFDVQRLSSLVTTPESSLSLSPHSTHRPSAGWNLQSSLVLTSPVG
jgi:hypothetical protein